MSLGRPITSTRREPETIECPRCGAQPGEDCTFALIAAPPRAVHPARYAALDLAAALAASEATQEAPR